MSHIILGATGHVGSALTQALLERGEAVTVVLHDSQKASDWQQKGAKFALADVHDVEALRGVFRQGKRLFLLNPPTPPSTDTAMEERKSLKAILAALDGSRLEKVVAESTYGAQPGDKIGDLSVLYEMEEALSAQPIPATIIRAAYYMSNWDAALQTAQGEGQVSTFYPPNFQLPMVAPDDIGELAARLLMEAVENTGLHFIEGPQTYSSSDVAEAFDRVLEKPVETVEIPRSQWHQSLKQRGFSNEAAASFVAMTAATLEAKSPMAVNPTRGTTSLSHYIEQLVHRQETAS